IDEYRVRAGRCVRATLRRRQLRFRVLARGPPSCRRDSPRRQASDRQAETGRTLPAVLILEAAWRRRLPVARGEPAPPRHHVPAVRRAPRPVLDAERGPLCPCGLPVPRPRAARCRAARLVAAVSVRAISVSRAV